MSKTENKKNDQSEKDTFVLEHVDRRGRVSMLPMRHDAQKLFAAAMFGSRYQRQPDETPAGNGIGEAVKSLTARQWQVFDLLISGLSSKQIAYELSISPRTVDIHRAQLKQKMGVRNTASLVRIAFLAA